jgi:hypothetical protein
MTAISGTNVIAPVVPYTTDDQYPSHDALYGLGGLREVASLVERDAIPSLRRRHGMLVYVAATDKTYQLQADLLTWKEFAGGAGSDSGAQVPLTLAATPYVLDALDITAFRTARWVVTFRKGTDVLVLEIVATHDGTDASDMRPTSLQSGTGAMDVAAVVDIDTGFLRITASADTTGWVVTWARLYALAA